MAIALGGPARTIYETGFAFLDGATMRGLLARFGSLNDWDAFVRSWDDLRLDTYMADGGRYRRRRHAVFSGSAGAIVREPHQPHYQALEYNRLHGGIERWFAPIEAGIADGPTLNAILACSGAIFEELSACRRWRVEVHQFRIEAREREPGLPTPEGIHRDGVDYVIVLLVDRVNVTSGTTSIHALDGRTLGSFTLTTPLDAALLDDGRVAHGVTAIAPVDPAQPAHRDVLVVTWRAASARADASTTASTASR